MKAGSSYRPIGVGLKPKWALHVDTFEPKGAGPGYPILTHTFRGRTKNEARGYCEAHLGTDVFFRDCTKRGKWNGIVCPSFVRWEKL